jgi:hypothetical protein
MLKKILAAALLLPLLAFGQSYPSPTFNNLTVQGTFTATGKVGLGSLAAQAANTVVGNATGSSASPTAITVAGCNGAAQALQWTNGSGFGCNSAIATSGANANITSLSGLSTPLSVAQGGTGVASSTGSGSVVLSVSPAFTGTPTAPTATVGTNTTQLATTAFVQAAAGSGRLIGVQVFTAGGTYTPTTGTTSVIVEVQAAAGGSGGVAATGAGQMAASPGGGSGAYAKVRYTTGFSGATVTIGAVGTAGTAGGNGGNASATSFGALISCPGGNGSTAGSAAAVATGGLNTGAAATAAPTISGGTTIVSAAGQGTGPSGQINGSAIYVTGANSILGLGGSLPNGGVTQAAVSGSGYGAGPSGAVNGASASAAVGKAGQPAVVIVYEFS